MVDTTLSGGQNQKPHSLLQASIQKDNTPGFVEWFSIACNRISLQKQISGPMFLLCL